MATRRYSSAPDELSKLVGIPPPVVPVDMLGGTRLTGIWRNDPYEGHVGAMTEHVIAATFAGSGEAIATMDGRRVVAPARRGAITLAPSGHEGHWRLTETIAVSNIYLGQARLADCADQLAEGRSFELVPWVHHVDTRVFAIMKLIRDEVEHPQHHSLVFIEHALDLLCYQLIRSNSTMGDPALKPQRGMARWQVNRVLTFMRENISAQLTLQDLAAVAGMSRFHFCAAFREATGTPPHEYLTRLRMRMACELLRSHRMAIREVAMAVGYGTPSAFTATFHRTFGVTPRDYRRELSS